MVMSSTVSPQPPQPTTRISACVKLYYVAMPRQVTFTEALPQCEDEDDGVDNPFRPGGGLEREAEAMVNLIKQGKPITPVTSPSVHALPPLPNDEARTAAMANGSALVAVDEPTVTLANGTSSRKPVNAGLGNGTSNGKNRLPTSNGSNSEQPDARHTTTTTHGDQADENGGTNGGAEEVDIKNPKKAKCRCCVVQ